MTDRELLAAIVERYREAFGARLVGVALFGSRARGSARSDSDHDILLIAEGLPPDPFGRNAQVRGPLAGLRAVDVQVLARTPEEFLADVTPLHLDLALDAKPLFERDGFLGEHLGRLRALLEEAGLERDARLFWRWSKPHARDWAITWEGVRV